FLLLFYNCGDSKKLLCIFHFAHNYTAAINFDHDHFFVGRDKISLGYHVYSFIAKPIRAGTAQRSDRNTLLTQIIWQIFGWADISRLVRGLITQNQSAQSLNFFFHIITTASIQLYYFENYFELFIIIP